MVVSRRERYIVIGTVVALAALAVDKFALSPLLDSTAAAESRRATLLSERNRIQSVLDHRRQLAPKWRELASSGLKSEAAEAESQVLHAVRDWAEESGLALSLLKPERQTEKSRLPQISFLASGSGSMKGIAHLLWKVQAAGIPLKTTDLQIVSRKEGTDDLSFQLRISTVYSPRGQSQATATAAAARPADVAGGS